MTAKDAMEVWSTFAKAALLGLNANGHINTDARSITSSACVQADLMLDAYRKRDEEARDG